MLPDTTGSECRAAIGKRLGRLPLEELIWVSPVATANEIGLPCADVRLHKTVVFSGSPPSVL